MGGTEGEARERGIRDSLGWEYNGRRGPAGRVALSRPERTLLGGTYGYVRYPDSASMGNGLVRICVCGGHIWYYRDNTDLRYASP